MAPVQRLCAKSVAEHLTRRRVIASVARTERFALLVLSPPLSSASGSRYCVSIRPCPLRSPRGWLARPCSPRSRLVQTRACRSTARRWHSRGAYEAPIGMVIVLAAGRCGGLEPAHVESRAE